ncbi:MAG TPA: response regulator [Pyrinomonadaceae bacterium]|nr:response regulator [Pyrinomonadaceae bacterium]
MTTGRRKLLLADDSVTIQKVVSLTFSDEGFDVVTVGDGEGALRELEAEAPDIVLVDVFMPKLGGYEVCARIKADARFRHIPVMLLVGTFEPFDEAEARRIGADDVLTKPFQSIRNLVNKVGGLLGGQSDQEQDTRDVSPPAGAESRPGASLSNRNQAEASETGRGVDDSSGPLADPSPFADLVADDATIKATPGAELRGDYHPPSYVTSPASDVGETIEYFGQSVEPAPGQHEPPSVNREMVGAQTGEEPRGQMPPKAWDTGTEETMAGQPGLTTRMANATAASDALLDLGDIDPPAAAQADDFILDLAEDVPAYTRTTGAPVEAATVAASHESVAKFGVEAGEGAYQVAPSSGRQSADYAGAFAEASHGEAMDHSLTSQFPGTPYDGEEGHTQQTGFIAEPKQDSFSHDTLESFVVPVEAGEVGAPQTGADYDAQSAGEAVTGLRATSDTRAVPETSVPKSFYNTTPFSNVGEALAAGAGSMSGGGEMHADKLPPEMIDQIARRAVEHLSERVVRESAWEVVPDLAERLIRQRLDEERQK